MTIATYTTPDNVFRISSVLVNVHGLGFGDSG